MLRLDYCKEPTCPKCHFENPAVKAIMPAINGTVVTCPECGFEYAVEPVLKMLFNCTETLEHANIIDNMMGIVNKLIGRK